MLTSAENELLTRVGAGTPMGRMLRRYWYPLLLDSELVAGAPPKRVRLLGEDLVAFRDEHGDAGVLGEWCPHRGTSLAYAINADCSLQCIAHGWRIDARGRVLETPLEPEDSTLKDDVRHVACAVREAAGLIWLYLGPPELEPPFPAFDWVSMPREHLLTMKVREDCNWVQSMEGAIDSAHQTYLHVSRMRAEANVAEAEADRERGDRPTEIHLDRTGRFGRTWTDGRPRLETEDTPWGFRYAAIRRPLFDADRYKSVRVTQFVAPVYSMIPAPPGMSQVQIFVPLDDTHTMFVQVRCDLVNPIGEESRRLQIEQAGARMGIDIDADFRKVRHAGNDWLQDREEMAHGDRPSGILGLISEDQAMQESMGLIYDRRREHLATSDLAVIRMRRIMLASARATERGEPPVGLAEPIPYHLLRAEERTIPIDAPWQDVGALPVTAG